MLKGIDFTAGVRFQLKAFWGQIGQRYGVVPGIDGAGDTTWACWFLLLSALLFLVVLSRECGNELRLRSP